MELSTFKLEKDKSPFAPTFEFTIGITNVSDELDILDIREKLLIKEKEIINLYPGTHDGGTNLGMDSVTSRFPHYILWQYEEFDKIKYLIKEYHNEYCEQLNIKYDRLYSQAWFNVMRLGEKIVKHQHDTSRYSYLSAHLTISAEETNTYYYEPFTNRQWVEKNKAGKLTIFPSWVTHETDRVEKEQERITVAIDLLNHTCFMEDIYDDKKYRWIEIT